MVFKTCTIRGHVYEERESRLYDTERFEEPVCCNNIDVKFFFTILALCHTVQISNEDMKRLSARLSLTFDNPLKFMRRKKSSKIPNGNGNGAGDNISWDALLGDNLGKMEYQGSSPDEKALVEAADRIGVSFLGEDGNNMLVKIGDHTEMYERLQLIEFTSERKRMSIILRDKDGKIWLFCKGAESSVFPLCKDSALIEDTDSDINVFANKGLRTLAIAYREIPEEEYNKISESIQKLDTTKVESLQLVTQQYRVLERQLTLIGATAVEDCLQDDVADTLAALRRAAIKIWVLTGDKVETAINVAQSCAHISENDRRMFLIGVEDDVTLQAHVTECRRIISEPSYRELTLIVDGTSMSQILDTDYAKHFVEISMQCHAVLCCRLSPIQKAKIVKLIKNSKDRPVTAAIGDGANDISMIQEAHVGFGIFGREGHQAARSADFAFTKFSMIKKVLLVIGHWYYQRLATLIHYFFYKNLVLGNIMLFFQFQSAFSTQSIYDSLFLTIYNLVLTSVPVLLLSITEQRWPSNLLLKNPTLYREIARNRLMSWWYFSSWTLAAVYHSVVIYLVSYFVFRIPVINGDAKTVDLWSFGSLLFHLNVVIVNLKLWLQARYHTLIFVASVLLSVLAHVAITAVYSLLNLQYDGDVLGTYTRLLASLPFWIANVVVVIAALAPDLATRLVSDRWGRRVEAPAPTQSAFVSRL
ncbi:phospholipid-transporting ATPase IF-like [Ostrinia nubilalis]|uniref:phospholipid-transporting ATPase IF-like n=1 Tax=Ostrinia nubilalis TaxID=29057 RepID=UPI00308245E2